MSLTVAGLAALGMAASKGHDMYLAGCDVLGAEDSEVNQLAQAVKLEAMQQELQNASAPKPVPRARPEKSDDGMSAGSMLMIAGGLTVGMLALAAVFGRRRD